jgi:flagellar motor switch protein FliM
MCPRCVPDRNEALDWPGSHPQLAAELLGASGRLLHEATAKLEPIEERVREAAFQRVSEALGDAASDVVASGALLETDEAVKRALSID